MKKLLLILFLLILTGCFGSKPTIKSNKILNVTHLKIKHENLYEFTTPKGKECVMGYNIGIFCTQ